MAETHQTLWASFLFVTPQEKIYYSGDSGYGPHFKAIGEQFALSIWQSWKTVNMTRTGHIHMMLKKRRRLPMSALGRYYRGMPDALCWQNTADDPYQRLAAASEGREWRLVTPMLGEPVWSLIRHNHLTPGGANRQSGSEGEKRYEYIRSGD